MRILIVSDTHGRDSSLKRLLEQVKPIDMLVHCGDVEGSEDYIRSMVDCPVHMVAGNNDFFCDLPKEEEFLIGKYRVLLTHGHYYYITMGSQMIKEDARARGFDIVMFGHTHRPYLEQDQGITALNPGSLSFPRQEGRKPSYMMMELDRNGQAHFTINYIKK
ncbi:MAG: metallophosphoesterase [Lachnospiraceae bacterium]|jgi:putative phosphoesterase|nr:metallophosphoesterase [Lachnospiraceae bacterium]